MPMDIIMSIKTLKLMQAFDSLFPIGAYTLSNGMETYTQKELVTDKESLSSYLKAYLALLPYNECGFAAMAAKGEEVHRLDALYAASRSPRELRIGSEKLCARFLKLEALLGQYPLLQAYGAKISEGSCRGFHCIAIGRFLADVDADLQEGLEMYSYSLLASLVNHAVKLVPLRQSDGQRCLAEAMERIPETVRKALSVTEEELGISGFGFDFRSMQHEKLYSRIYIS